MQLFAQLLKKLRQEKKLTQSDVAHALKISRVAYTNYELGKREPDFATLNDIAKFFGVSIDFLLGLTSIRETACDILEDRKHVNRPDDYPLTEEQRELLEHLDKLDEETQKQFKKLIELYDIKSKVDYNEITTTSSSLKKSV